MIGHPFLLLVFYISVPDSLSLQSTSHFSVKITHQFAFCPLFQETWS